MVESSLMVPVQHQEYTYNGGDQEKKEEEPVHHSNHILPGPTLALLLVFLFLPVSHLLQDAPDGS